MTSPTPAVRWRRYGLASAAVLALLGGAVVAPVATAAGEPEVPTDSLIKPDQISDIVVWLASDASSLVTAAQIPADKGYLKI